MRTSLTAKQPSTCWNRWADSCNVQPDATSFRAYSELGVAVTPMPSTSSGVSDPMRTGPFALGYDARSGLGREGERGGALGVVETGAGRRAG